MVTNSSGSEVQAVIVDFGAESLLVEEVSGRTSEADLAVPVPVSAAEVLKGDFLNKANTVVKGESLVTFNTGSVIVKGLAKVVLGSTDTLGIESPFLRTSKTDLAIPVPFSTAEVSQFLDKSVTSSIDGESISLVALKTNSFRGENLTEIVQLLASSFLVEGPSGRTSETDLELPVPLGACFARRSSVQNRVQKARTVELKGIASVTGGTGSTIGVEFSTEIGNRLADSVDIEDGSGNTLDTGNQIVALVSFAVVNDSISI